MSPLPQETRHIRLQKGRFPSQDNEILVSQSLYSSLKTNDLKIIYDDLEIDLKIVGVLYPSLFEEKNIYCSSLLQEKIPFLKDDYSLVLESQDIKKLYQLLSSFTQDNGSLKMLRIFSSFIKHRPFLIQ